MIVRGETFLYKFMQYQQILHYARKHCQGNLDLFKIDLYFFLPWKMFQSWLKRFQGSKLKCFQLNAFEINERRRELPFERIRGVEQRKHCHIWAQVGATIPLWDKTRSFWDINNSLSHERGSERSEWAVRVNERTDERVAQYLRLDSCLFQTTVQRQLLGEGKAIWWEGNVWKWSPIAAIWNPQRKA